MKLRTKNLSTKRAANSMYAIDPPMRDLVHVRKKKSFPGAFL